MRKVDPKRLAVVLAVVAVVACLLAIIIGSVMLPIASVDSGLSQWTDAEQWERDGCILFAILLAWATRKDPS